MAEVPDHAARIVALADRAIARVDRNGVRALTLLSVEQIEARTCEEARRLFWPARVAAWGQHG